MELIFKSKSLKETLKFASKLSSLLTKGDIIVMDGDLGAGKTSFAKGIGEGLNVNETIISPTFNIVRCYFDGRIPFYHIDAYRLEDNKNDIGLEEYLEGDGICLVEWGKYIDYLLKDYLKIDVYIDGSEERTYILTSSNDHYDHIIEVMKNEL